MYANKKVNDKSAELIERFRVLRKHVAFSKGIVVTLPFLVDKYRHYLYRLKLKFPYWMICPLRSREWWARDSKRRPHDFRGQLMSRVLLGVG